MDIPEYFQGFVFMEDKLYWFDPKVVVVMTPWPNPRAWLKGRPRGRLALDWWADFSLCRLYYTLTPLPWQIYIKPPDQPLPPPPDLFGEITREQERYL